MIKAVSTVYSNSSKVNVVKKTDSVSFSGNPLYLIKNQRIMGRKISNIAHELPVTKKALIAADKNPGPLVLDVLGNPIEDPNMPGTYIHELAKTAVENHGSDFFEALGHGLKAIFENLFG